jgi:hypothetical protein
VQLAAEPMEHFSAASLNSGLVCGVPAKRRQSSPVVFAVKVLGVVRVLLAMTVSFGANRYGISLQAFTLCNLRRQNETKQVRPKNCPICLLALVNLQY